MKILSLSLLLTLSVLAEVIDISDLKITEAFPDHNYAIVNFYDKTIKSAALNDIIKHVEQTFSGDQRKVGFGMTDSPQY